MSDLDGALQLENVETISMLGDGGLDIDSVEMILAPLLNLFLGVTIGDGGIDILSPLITGPLALTPRSSPDSSSSAKVGRLVALAEVKGFLENS